MGTDRGLLVFRTVLDTDGLLRDEKTAAWMEAAALALVPKRCRVAEPERFAARISVMELGPAQLSANVFAPFSCYRSPRLVRQSDPELYQLAVITTGRQGMEQAGHRTSLEPGEMIFYDSSRPFEASVGTDGRAGGSLLVQFPRELMPLPEKTVAPLCGSSLSASGIGHVFRQTLRALADTETDLTDRDRARLGTTIVDLAAAVVARQCEQTSALTPEARTEALYHEIVAFIRRHVDNPDLTPPAVAAAHCISTRTLHRIFQARGETVSGMIRGERINRCRRDLADPGLRAVPVGSVGARWGFPRASDFTRAFKAATGVTPTVYRARLLEQGS
ncbi:helix-turn-helix domain-containing protein [Streptomyces sp. NPDC006129]|uniref:AraC-like ligand-binding domain-containing protein n=1 Tax=Streptomyces sp. NPDC006129 TaxID=3155348 RepID=UPI0033B8795E